MNTIEREEMHCPRCGGVLMREFFPVETFWVCEECLRQWTAQELAQAPEYSEHETPPPPPSNFL